MNGPCQTQALHLEVEQLQSKVTSACLHDFEIPGNGHQLEHNIYNLSLLYIKLRIFNILCMFVNQDIGSFLYCSFDRDTTQGADFPCNSATEFTLL